MTPPSSRWIFLCLAVVLCAALSALPVRAGEPDPPVVLLELFTSQGCSSCPPADRLLSRIGRDGQLEGVPVIPLAYHVDYWDRIGWKDPFSSAAWSERQRAYGRELGLYSIYTPQVVVGGRAHTVGSDEDRLRQLVARAAEPRRASIDLSLEIVADSLRVSALPATSGAALEANVALRLAIFENGLVTEVRSGENAHRTLHEDYVVRRLLELPRGEEAVEVHLESDWDAQNLGVVAFLQNRDTLEVLAAERRTVAETS